MEVVNIHYGELGLKGNNKPQFERQLINNIKEDINEIEYDSIEKKDARIIIYLNEKSNKETIKEKLEKTFGIAWFSFSYMQERNLDGVTSLIEKYAKENLQEKKIKLETKRADKTFELNSIQINSYIGKKLEESSINTEIKNPDKKIYLEILKDSVLITFDKIRGLGGLPSGSSGKILCLLSGGIDSPVAAWLMMKRGCIVDFLHIHNLKSNEQVKNSKITKLVEKLKLYGNKKTKLCVAPYHYFQNVTIGTYEKLELILFRRFIAKIANELCKKNNYLGVVTGDNVGQVASQTLENLFATDEAFNLPVYRPVAGQDKLEIIELAKKIDTYEESIKEYKDCCSLVAVKHPATKAKLDEIKKIEQKVEIEKIVDETLKEVEIIEV